MLITVGKGGPVYKHMHYMLNFAQVILAQSWFSFIIFFGLCHADLHFHFLFLSNYLFVKLFFETNSFLVLIYYSCTTTCKLILLIAIKTVVILNLF